MSLPKITVDWLMARVRDVDGCLVWTGYSAGGRPLTNLGTRGGRRPISVRRLVWVSAGRRLKPGHEIVCTCGVDNCVELAHLEQQTHSAHLAGRTKPLTTRARIAASKRATSKLSDEDVAAIRASEQDNDVIAAEYGCTKEYVRLLKAGLFRRDLTSPLAGVFA
jgi:hypothetical protein